MPEEKKVMLRNLELRRFFKEVESCSQCNKKLYCYNDVKCAVHMLSLSITEKDNFKCIFKNIMNFIKPKNQNLDKFI